METFKGNWKRGEDEEIDDYAQSSSGEDGGQNYSKEDISDASCSDGEFCEDDGEDYSKENGSGVQSSDKGSTAGYKQLTCTAFLTWLEETIYSNLPSSQELSISKELLVQLSPTEINAMLEEQQAIRDYIDRLYLYFNEAVKDATEKSI
jgi:hypothetical protein